MSRAVRALQQMTWTQRLLVGVVGCNCVLILYGIAIVPATLTSADGMAALLGALCIQLAVAALALVGPWSLQRSPSNSRMSLALGGIFALLYLSDIVVDFTGGSDPINIYAIFIGVACVGGFAASYHTQRRRQGVVTAIWAPVIGTALWSTGIMLIYYVTWGSHQQYLFWLGDGAIDDFRRSGGTDLSAFLMQDVQGALVFHPLLSILIGAIGGLVSSSMAWCLLLLQRALLGERNHG